MYMYCISEVNKIYERYYVNTREKLPTVQSLLHNFVAELKTIAKMFILGIRNKRTTRKLLQMRDFTLNT